MAGWTKCGQPPTARARVNYELIIFDFDGTLADSFPCFLEAMTKVSREMRLRPVPSEELPALRRLSAREIMARLGLRWWRLPRVARLLRLRMSEQIATIALFPGIAEMLGDLRRRGIELVLVTSNSEANVRTVLGPELSALFSSYECSVSLFGKRARFRRISRRTTVPRGSILCIGDELRDAEAARAENLAFGAVVWGYAESSALEQTRPAHLFREPREISATLIH